MRITGPCWPWHIYIMVTGARLWLGPSCSDCDKRLQLLGQQSPSHACCRLQCVYADPWTGVVSDNHHHAAAQFLRAAAPTRSLPRACSEYARFVCKRAPKVIMVRA